MMFFVEMRGNLVRDRNILLATVRRNEEDRNEYLYDESNRFKMLSKSYINVYAPYEILEQDGKRYIVSVNCREDFEVGYRGFIDSELHAHSHCIAPLQLDILLFEALKVDLDNEISILNFCNQYGVLGEFRQKNTFDEYTLTGLNECGWIESLDFFKKELMGLLECFFFYIMTETDNEAKLIGYWKEQIARDIKGLEEEIEEEKKKSKEEEFQEEYIWFLEDLKNDYLKKMNNLPPKKEMVINAKGSLVGRINKKLPNVFLSLQITPEGELIEGISSFTLLGSLYYQLYQNIVKGHKYVECKYCGAYFLPLRKSDMEFCPNEPGDVKRSKHENRYNAMIKRVRNWYFIDGFSPEEIQEKIRKPKKRTLEEIKHWIETYNK